MVAFARARAKSIIARLRFSTLSKIKNASNQTMKVEEISNTKNSSSNYFLEAIKSGGIWLS
tara:strand:- start:387 stop:569 length:183 start_codon:yes stop_codon:yes gene_type:complete